MTRTYEKLHKEGKTMMQKCVDTHKHNHVHARRVQETSEEILTELREQNPGKYDSQEYDLMVLTAAWWHDAFKRTQKKPSFYAYFNEGRESAKIFLNNKDAQNLPDDEKMQIASAIEIHNKPYLRMFAWRSTLIITRILLEADGVETVRYRRIFRLAKKLPIHLRIFEYVLILGLTCFYFLMPLSKAARKRYWHNITKE